MTYPPAVPPPPDQPTYLQHAVHQAVGRGARLEYIDAHMAVIATGRPVNHVAYGVGIIVLVLIVAPVLGFMGLASAAGESPAGLLVFWFLAGALPLVLLVVWLVKAISGGVRRYRLTVAPNGVVHTESLGR